MVWPQMPRNQNLAEMANRLTVDDPMGLSDLGKHMI